MVPTVTMSQRDRKVLECAPKGVAIAAALNPSFPRVGVTIPIPVED